MMLLSLQLLRRLRLFVGCQAQPLRHLDDPISSSTSAIRFARIGWAIATASCHVPIDQFHKRKRPWRFSSC